MINSTEIKPNMYFIWENELYRCITIDLNKTAMAKMKVKVKVRNPRTGVVKELGLIGSDRVDEVSIDRREMQFLYEAGGTYYFMDQETYEQIELQEESLEWEKTFLTPNLVVNIQMFNNEVIGISLPDKVEMELVECENAVRGDTATNALKNAVTETGLQLKVPMFIQNGERIIVSTIDGKYSGRA